MSLWKGRRRLRFRPQPLTECTAYLPQPSAGWYHIYPFALEKEADYEELRWCLRGEETIVLLLADIGAYRNCALPRGALERFVRILDFFKAHGKEMLVRIVYDTQGKALEKEPERMETVEGHMRQLGAVLRPYAGDIVAFQGLFIGNWGEMHGSRFLSAKKLRRLLNVWREAVGEEIPVAVRTPRQWRMLQKKETEGALGFFNDGMFGSESDLGTYGTKAREEAEWEESWRREAELLFMEPVNRRLPYGGEAVGEAEAGALPQAVAEMRKTHVSYLNAAHDEKRLTDWKKTLWREAGVWDGVNGYDYIGAHLGVRPVLRGADVKLKNAPQKPQDWKKTEVNIEVRIENAGFAGFTEDVELAAAIQPEQGAQELTELGSVLIEAGRLAAGQPETSVRLSADLICPVTERGRLLLLLQLRRRRDGRAYRFANQDGCAWMSIGLLADR